MKNKQLKSLAAWISSFNGSDPTAFSKELNRIIYMLHYLPDEEFTRQEVQQATHLLYEINQLLNSRTADRQSKNDSPN